MLEHALTRPHHEVCGLLGGQDGVINNYYPVDNIAADQKCSFLMDPVEQLKVMRLMRERGEYMAGIFHTHPYSPAIPSARDHEEARYPDVYYLIISLMHTDPELTAYFYDGMKFKNVSVNVDKD